MPATPGRVWVVPDADAALVVRTLGPGDEVQAVKAHAELTAEGSSFLLAHRPDEPWDSYLMRLDGIRAGLALPPGKVPATLLVGVVGGALVGMLAVRHRLTPRLERVGGHVGYAVRPAFRRRGYATALLRHGLGVARDLGIDPALVTCDDDNVGSIRVIESCGGRLDDVIEVPDVGRKRRYWVPTD